MNKTISSSCKPRAAIILLLITLITGNSKVQAQKDFEGYIVYKATEPDYHVEEFDTVYPVPARRTQKITIYLSPGKILIRTHGIPGESGSEVLILPDSGTVYDIDGKDSSYRVKTLRVTKHHPSIRETIAGHTATPVSQDLPGSIMEGPTTFWFADSLYYHVPEKYAGNEELIMVNKNRILLKAVMIPRYGYDYEHQETDPGKVEDNAVVLVATEVVRTKNDPNIFSIPAGFKMNNHLNYTEDSVTVMADTAFVAPAEIVTEPDAPPARQIPGKKPLNSPKRPKKEMKKEEGNQ